MADEKAFDEMVAQVAKEKKEARKDDEFLKQMFMYEMANYEYCLVPDTSVVLLGCDIKRNEMTDRMWKIWEEAKKEYIENCDDL